MQPLNEWAITSYIYCSEPLHFWFCSWNWDSPHLFDQSCYLLVHLPFHNLLLSLSSIHCYSLYRYVPCGKQETWRWTNVKKSTQDGSKNHWWLQRNYVLLCFLYGNRGMIVLQGAKMTGRVFWNASWKMPLGNFATSHYWLQHYCKSFMCHWTVALPSGGIQMCPHSCATRMAALTCRLQSNPLMGLQHSTHFSNRQTHGDAEKRHKRQRVTVKFTCETSRLLQPPFNSW